MEIIKGDLPNKKDNFSVEISRHDLLNNKEAVIARRKIEYVPTSVSFEFIGKEVAHETKKGIMACDDTVIVKVEENGQKNSYPITKEEFDTTYEKNGDVYMFKPKVVIALEVDRSVFVRIPWKTLLNYANKGDYVVYNFMDNKELFVFSESEFKRNYEIIGNRQEIFEKYAKYIRK